VFPLSPQLFDCVIAIFLEIRGHHSIALNKTLSNNVNNKAFKKHVALHDRMVYQGSNRDALFICQNRDEAPVDPQYEFRCQRGSGLVVAEEGLQLNANNPQDLIVTQTNPETSSCITF
jgi:hypothetical protein